MIKKIFHFLLVLVFCKLAAFIRDAILSYQFGASAISDAYFVSLTIPGSIFAFVSVAIKSIFIPAYTKIKEAQGEDNAEKYTQKLCIAFICASLLLTIFGWVFARPIVFLYASGFDAETANIAVFLTRLNLLTLALLSVEYVYEALLQVKGQYTISELTSLPANIILIASFYCASSFGVVFFSIGKIVSVVAQLALTAGLLKFKFHKKFKLRVTLKESFQDPNVKGSLKNSLPVIAGTSGHEINKLVDRSVASTLTVGGISSLIYANRLNSLVIEICVNSVVTIVFPRISQLAGKKDLDGIKNEIVSAISYMLFFLLPATAVMLMFSREITTIVFGRGNGVSTIDNTSICLFFYSFGVIAVGIREIMVRGFYALGNTRIPAIIASISIGINICLNLILSSVIGMGGLSLATSIASVFAMLANTILLSRKIGKMNLSSDITNVMKLFFSTLVSSGLAYLVFSGLKAPIGSNLSFVIAFVCMAMCYLGMLILLKSSIIEELKAAVKAF